MPVMPVMPVIPVMDNNVLASNASEEQDHQSWMSSTVGPI